MNKKQLIVVGGIFSILIFLCFNFSLAQTSLEVSGIFYEEKGQSYAIVNGKIIKVGDKIEEAEVTEINKDSVKFRNNDKVFIKNVEYSSSKQVKNVTSDKEGQSCWGAFAGTKHYDKALELYKKGDGLRGINNEKAFKILDESLAEANSSLKYDCITSSMRKELDYIIAICNQYNHNALISEQKIREEELERVAETSRQANSSWKFSGSSSSRGIRLSEQEIQRRNNEQPPPPQVCQGGICHQATPKEIEYFENKIKNKK